MFTGIRANYRVTQPGGPGTGFTVVDQTAGRDGADTLRGFEFLRFADGQVGAAAALTTGTAESDTIVATGGSDTLDTGAGDDVVTGGSGNDAVTAGIANDTLFGETDDDRLQAEAGDDDVAGGDGSDRVEAGDGNDFAVGRLWR